MEKTVLRLKGRAKLNLTLDVLGKREDGYHELETIMQTLELCDDIELRLATGREDELRTNLEFLPRDGQNTALAAARLFFESISSESGGIFIRLTKKIPVCAGMGGGSSDAAAILKGLNERYGYPLSTEELMELGESLGADVPFCVLGGTALARGKGELLTPLKAMPDCWFVISKPGVSVSTKKVFAGFDCENIEVRPDTEGALEAIEKGQLPQLCRRMYNVFESGLAKRHAEIGDIKGRLIGLGALGAAMTGTGSSVFGAFADENEAKKAYKTLIELYPNTFLTKNSQ